MGATEAWLKFEIKTNLQTYIQALPKNLVTLALILNEF